MVEFFDIEGNTLFTSKTERQEKDLSMLKQQTRDYEGRSAAILHTASVSPQAL